MAKQVRGDTFLTNIVGTTYLITGAPITELTEPEEYAIGSFCYSTGLDKIFINVGGTPYTWRYISLT